MKQMIENLITDLDKVNKEFFTKSDIKLFLEFKINHYDEQPVEFSGMILIPKTHEVIYDDKRYILPKKQFKILQYLMMNHGKCISRDAIFAHCWEKDVIVGERTIDVHICKIKKIFNKNISIYTQKGVGYKLLSNEV